MWLLHKNTGDSLKDVYLPLMVVIKKEQLMGCLYMIQSLKEKKKRFLHMHHTTITMWQQVWWLSVASVT